MTTAGEQDPLGTGLLCELLPSVLHIHPAVLMSVFHVSGFLLCPSSSLLCIWLSQSVYLGPHLMLCSLYFSVDMTLAQHFSLQNRCPQKTYLLLLPFAVALRCVPPQVISGRWIPPESQRLCLTWQCGTCSALEQQLLLSYLVLAFWWPHPISHCFMLQRIHHGCTDLLNKGFLGHYSPVMHSSLIQIKFWCH